MNPKINEFEATHNLVGGQMTWGDGEVIFHDGQTPPHESEVDAELVRMQAEYDAQEYARDRANEYPSITNVVVALAEKAEGRSAMWDEITAQRLDVKSKYPKP